MPDSSEYWMVVGIVLTYIIMITILGFIGVGNLSSTCSSGTLDATSCLGEISFTEGLTSLFVNPFDVESYEGWIMALVFFIPIAIISALILLNIARGR